MTSRHAASRIALVPGSIVTVAPRALLPPLVIAFPLPPDRDRIPPRKRVPRQIQALTAKSCHFLTGMVQADLVPSPVPANYKEDPVEDPVSSLFCLFCPTAIYVLCCESLFPYLNIIRPLVVFFSFFSFSLPFAVSFFHVGLSECMSLRFWSLQRDSSLQGAMLVLSSSIRSMAWDSDKGVFCPL